MCSTMDYDSPIDLDAKKDSSEEPASAVNWPRVISLCAVGFLVNCQPSEAYLTHYLKHDKHLTSEQLDNDVWPYDTYGSFAFLIPIGLVAEVCGYRAAIGAGLIFRQATRLLILFTGSVETMALMQLTYAGATAANTVYFAYVYMCVPPEQYLRVTCWIHMSHYLGNALGSLLGQILYSYAGFDAHLENLFYLSWGFSSLGLAVFLLLFPAPLHPAPPSLVSMLRQDGPSAVLHELQSMYKSFPVQLWSCWWLMGIGSHQMIANYYQTQFSEIDPDCADTLGYVEAIMMLFSAVASLAPSHLAKQLTFGSLPVILGSSLAVGFLYYASTLWQSSVYDSYALNIAAISIYSFQYAAASAVIATQIASGRYAILFTTNSFISYGISTIIQQAGSQHDLSTSWYYYLAAGQQLVIVALVLVLVLISWISGVGDMANKIEPEHGFAVDEVSDYHAYDSLVPDNGIGSLIN